MDGVGAKMKMKNKIKEKIKLNEGSCIQGETQNKLRCTVADFFLLLVICRKLKAMSYCQARTWNVQNIVGKFNDTNGNDCNKFETRLKKSLDLVIQVSSIKWK